MLKKETPKYNDQWLHTNLKINVSQGRIQDSP